MSSPAAPRCATAVHDGIIPANLGLAEAELALGGKMGRELDAQEGATRGRDDYDLVMIDCPPALGLLTVNALVASDYALISAEAQYFSLQGVEQALEVIELARESLNPDLEWLGVVLNIADMRTRHSREAFDSLRQHFGEKLFETTIRASIAYAESAERAVSILDYRPDLGADYLTVAEETLKRLGMDRTAPARRGDDERRRGFLGASLRSASMARRFRAGIRAGRSDRATSARTAGSSGTRAWRTPPTAPAAPPGTRRGRRSGPSRRWPTSPSGPPRPPS